MARTFTADERAAIASDHHDVLGKLEIKDSEGNWVDISSGLDGGSADWFTGATLEESVDANSMQLQATLLRDHVPLGLSLSPLMTASPLNQDSSPAYAPFLDLSRQWRLSVSVVEHGDAANYKEIGAGTYDVIEIEDPEPAIQITGRDWGSTLLDVFIDVEQSYSDDVTREAMEDVLQEMLDTNLGAGVITLYTPVSPATDLYLLKIQGMSLMAALNLVADIAGFTVRFRYDSSNVLRLTLYAVDREAEPGDEEWELGPDEYTALPVAKLDLSGVRNRVVVRYWNYTTGVPQTVTSEDATSITRYGGPHEIARVLFIDLSKNTNIRTAATATAFADFVLADLKDPPFQQQVAVPGFWMAQLGDYGKLLANGVHYDEDQYGGVSRIRHELVGGKLNTTLFLGGQPKGRYRAWTAIPGVQLERVNSLVVQAALQSATGTQAVIRIRVADKTPGGSGDVTVTYTATGCTINTPASPQTLAQADITDDLATTDFVDVTVDRAAASVGTGRVVIVATRAGRVDVTESVDVPPQDTSIPQGSIAIASDGVPTTKIDGPSWAASIRYATSTSSQPDEATVLASGTTVNARQVSFTGSALALGGQYFVTAIPFSASGATGYQGASIALKAQRHDATATKTVRFGANGFTPFAFAFGDIDHFVEIVDGYIRIINHDEGGSPAYVQLYDNLQVPDGVTLTDLSVELYTDGDDAIAEFEFFRTDTSGGRTSLGSNSSNQHGAWETKSITISESTSSRRYQLWLKFSSQLGTPPDTDARCAGYSVTYSMPSTANTL